MSTTQGKSVHFEGFSTFSSKKLTKIQKNRNIQFVIRVLLIIQFGKYFLITFSVNFVKDNQCKIVTKFPYNFYLKSRF